MGWRAGRASIEYPPAMSVSTIPPQIPKPTVKNAAPLAVAFRCYAFQGVRRLNSGESSYRAAPIRS